MGVETHEQALACAAGLVPMVAERAREAERLRRIPDATVAQLREAGLFRIANPDRYGGVGLEYDTVLDVGVELGRGCGSTSWCYTVWAAHNWMAGLWPEAAQEEFFGSGPDVLCASGFNPAGGRVEPAAGGHLVSGRWDFASGVDASDWMMLAAVVPGEGPGLFLVPRAEYRIEDTWFASGLRASGSKDVVIEEPVFVPAHRFVSYAAMAAARTPGRELHPRASYRLPMYAIVGFALSGPLLGIAVGALEAFEPRARERSIMTGGKIANQASVQARLAEAAAELDCARLLMRRDLDEMLGMAVREEFPSLEDRVRFRRDHGYIGMLSVRAVNRLFEVSGAHALFDASPLQRAHRDVNAGSHHVGVIWDTCAELYGRVHLGLGPQPGVQF